MKAYKACGLCKDSLLNIFFGYQTSDSDQRSNRDHQIRLGDGLSSDQ